MLLATSSAIYLQDAAGAICWLGTPATAAHTRAIIVDALPRDVRPGMRARTHDGCLRLAEGVSIRLDSAQPWSPRVLRRELALPLAQLGPRIAALDALRGEADAGREPDAFTKLVRAKLAVLLDAARPAIFAGDLGVVPALADRLAGLGPGLTPAGDDALGGLLFALRLLGVLYPRAVRWPATTGESIATAAATRTHPISAALLADFARGDAPAPLHDLAHELFRAASAGPRAETVARLHGIGHSSGDDLLAGFRLGLRAIAMAQTRWSGSWQKT